VEKTDPIHHATRPGLKLTQSGKARGGIEERSEWKRNLLREKGSIIL